MSKIYEQIIYYIHIEAMMLAGAVGKAVLRSQLSQLLQLTSVKK